MKKYCMPIILLILFTFSFTLIMPTTLAMAASPLNTVTQTSSSNSKNSSSSFNLLNVLIGMLLGNLLGKNNTSENPNVNIKPVPFQGTDSNSTTSSSKGDAIIATAKTYMGVPYVFGGESPTSGLDCSSFTQLVMKKNGITLPRTAAEQYNQGTAVDKEDLQIGDLVFFTTYKPGASHVGFYMGDQQFIHASSAAKQVTISSLDEAYYTEHYIGSRRYIK
ncbi:MULTISPECIES: C40 family peptidase [Pelosinus]|uniref:NLP/P60 protein n=2 Tax=Pelosinus TaxID=365348 RepID=I8TTP9_9FIRM|nr:MULTISPECIES: C40 family peptidase [Pelosinus]AJQ28276.1 NLP/P60 protein [Pelosinus fermentans JBW45]MCC5465190.1 C40 family peptidase [Pelosinus baikalensis]MCC5465195.1 C40 family peptidase [Pelosinus baikalensis]